MSRSERQSQKIPYFTTLCSSELLPGISIFKKMLLTHPENWWGQMFQGQGHNTKFKDEGCSRCYAAQPYVEISYYIDF